MKETQEYSYPIQNVSVGDSVGSNLIQNSTGKTVIINALLCFPLKPLFTEIKRKVEVQKQIFPLSCASCYVNKITSLKLKNVTLFLKQIILLTKTANLTNFHIKQYKQGFPHLDR